MKNLLLGEKNKLLNRNLHVKVDIGNVKVDIQNKKVDIEDVLAEKSKKISRKTIIHIRKLYKKFGFDEIFGRNVVMELLKLKGSGASKLLSNLVQGDIIEPVLGNGKGKYKFKKDYNKTER